MFAIRNTANNVVSLQAEFDGTTRKIQINHWENSAWVSVFSTPSTLTLGKSSSFESMNKVSSNLFRFMESSHL